VSCRGDLYRIIGMYPEALADYGLLLEQDPDDADSIADRAKVYQDMGEQAHANAEFGRALQLDPAFAGDINPYLAH